MRKSLVFKLGMMAGLVILLFGGTSSDTPDIIFWSDDGLEWADFGGEPRFDFSNRNVSALTSSGIIHYRGCDENDMISYRVRAYFEKKESWVKEVARTDYHLAHEQLHFDVTELYARKLRKILDDRKFMCGEEVEFERFVRQYISNWQVTQQAYDFSTHHSMDKKKQKEWHHRIAFELSLLEDYKE